MAKPKGKEGKELLSKIRFLEEKISIYDIFVQDALEVT